MHNRQMRLGQAKPVTELWFKESIRTLGSPNLKLLKIFKYVF